MPVTHLGIRAMKMKKAQSLTLDTYSLWMGKVDNLKDNFNIIIHRIMGKCLGNRERALSPTWAGR